MHSDSIEVQDGFAVWKAANFGIRQTVRFWSAGNHTIACYETRIICCFAALYAIRVPASLPAYQLTKAFGQASGGASCYGDSLTRKYLMIF